jgi:hypothetical protein
MAKKKAFGGYHIVPDEHLAKIIGDVIAFYTNSDCIKEPDLGCPGRVFRIVERLEKVDSTGQLVVYNCPIFNKKE